MFIFSCPRNSEPNVWYKNLNSFLDDDTGKWRDSQSLGTLKYPEPGIQAHQRTNSIKVIRTATTTYTHHWRETDRPSVENSKKVMPNTVAKNVAGRNSMVSAAVVFMAALSFLVSVAIFWLTRLLACSTVSTK